MAEEPADTVKNYPSLPSNYVSIAQLQERWLKKQQEEKEKQEREEAEKTKHQQIPVRQNASANRRSHHTRFPAGKKRENQSEKGNWVAKPEVIKITAPRVEDETREYNNNKKKGDFKNRELRFVTRDKGKVVNVEDREREFFKGKNEEVEEVAMVCMAEAVEDREFPGHRCNDGFRGKKIMGVKVGKVGNKAESVEKYYAKEEEGVLVGVKETRKYNKKKEGYFGNRKPRVVTGDKAKVLTINVAEEAITVLDSVKNGEREASKGKLEWNNKQVKEVATVCMVEVVEENMVDREFPRQRCNDGLRGMNDRKTMEKEEISVDVNETTTCEKVSLRGTFNRYDVKRGDDHPLNNEQNFGNLSLSDKRNGYGDKWVYESTTRHEPQKMLNQRDCSFGIVENKEESLERSHNAEVKVEEGVLVDVKDTTAEKVRVRGGPVVEQGDDGPVVNNKKKEGYFKNRRPRVKKDVTGGEAKASSILDVGKEEIMVLESAENSESQLSKGKSLWNNKEVEEVATVCMVEVVGENKVDREFPRNRRKDGFRGKKDRKTIMGIKNGIVGNKAESVEQPGQEHNAEEEEISVDVKEITSGKVRVRDALHRYDVKKKDDPLKTERNFSDLSLSDRRNDYGDKWRYGSTTRYEPRKMLKQRHSSFVWVKKGESSNGNVAETETQVECSSQSCVRVSSGHSESNPK